MNLYEILAYLPAFLVFGICIIYGIISGGIKTILFFLIFGIIFLSAILWTKYWMDKSKEKT